MDQYLTAIKYIKGHPALCSLICSYETKLQNIRFFSKVTRKKKLQLYVMPEHFSSAETRTRLQLTSRHGSVA